ncbi:MAG: putative membrane protein YgcG [Rhodothermales bacterium]
MRIELGRDWGGQWDPHCQRILDRHVLPEFKSERYSRGISAGVREIAAMARIGPVGQPPKVSVAAGISGGDLLGASNRDNPIPMRYRIWVLAAGGLLCLIGLFNGRRGLWILGTGALLICSVYAFWVALVILIVVILIANALDDRDDGYYCGGRRRRRRRSCTHLPAVGDPGAVAVATVFHRAGEEHLDHGKRKYSYT